LFPMRTVARYVHATDKPPIRSLPVGSYVVYFRVIEAKRLVTILEIRHAARRPPTYLR
jgi:plasmid stabilization system protein ParE